MGRREEKCATACISPCPPSQCCLFPSLLFSSCRASCLSSPDLSPAFRRVIFRAVCASDEARSSSPVQIPPEPGPVRDCSSSCAPPCGSLSPLGTRAAFGWAGAPPLQAPGSEPSHCAAATGVWATRSGQLTMGGYSSPVAPRGDQGKGCCALTPFGFFDLSASRSACLVAVEGGSPRKRSCIGQKGTRYGTHFK